MAWPRALPLEAAAGGRGGAAADWAAWTPPPCPHRGWPRPRRWREELGCLPLALAQAACLHARDRQELSPATASCSGERGPQCSLRPERHGDYPGYASLATWQTSRLTAAAEDVPKRRGRCSSCSAFFAPEALPAWRCSDWCRMRCRSACGSELDRDEAIGALDRFRLITGRGGHPDRPSAGPGGHPRRRSTQQCARGPQPRRRSHSSDAPGQAVNAGAHASGPRCRHAAAACVARELRRPSASGSD